MGSVLHEVATVSNMLRLGATKNVILTLGAAGTITRLDIPADACEVTLLPAGGQVATAIDEDPEIQTNAGTDLDETALGIGVLLETGIAGVYSLDRHGRRITEIRFVGDTGGETVQVSFH